MGKFVERIIAEFGMFFECEETFVIGVIVIGVIVIKLGFGI